MESKRIYGIVCGLICMFSVQNVMSMSFVYNQYLKWRLGSALVNAAATCPKTTPCNLQHIVEDKYQAPAYIQFAKNMSPRESAKSYVMHASRQLIDSLNAAFYRTNPKTTASEFFTVPLLRDLQAKITESLLQQVLGEKYTKEENKDARRALVDKAQMGLINYFENRVKKLEIPSDLDVATLREEKISTHITGTNANEGSVTAMNENRDDTIELMQRCINALEQKPVAKGELDKAQKAAQEIWTEVTTPYIKNFEAQQEFIKKLNPLSALERWHRNRMVERLKYLQDNSAL
jgi:hypothetical protein